jgi:hypothetical protein
MNIIYDQCFTTLAFGFGLTWAICQIIDQWHKSKAEHNQVEKAYEEEESDE